MTLFERYPTTTECYRFHPCWRFRLFLSADATSGILQRCKNEKRSNHGGVRVRRYEDGARGHRGGRQAPSYVAIVVLASVLIINRKVQSRTRRTKGSLQGPTPEQCGQFVSCTTSAGCRSSQTVVEEQPSYPRNTPLTMKWYYVGLRRGRYESMLQPKPSLPPKAARFASPDTRLLNFPSCLDQIFRTHS